MFVPRLCRPRAPKEASAKPPPTTRYLRRLNRTKSVSRLSTFIAIAMMLLPYPAFAADTLAGPTAASVLLLIFFVVVAIGISFVCSLAESSLLSMTPSYIADVQESNPKKANMLRKLKVDNIDQSLAAILTLNTVAHTLGSIGAGAQATIVFGSAWFGLFSAIMTLAILFLSEIIPKTLGTLYWRQLSGVVAHFVRGIILLLYPLIWFSERLTKLLVRGKEPQTFSRREFAALASIGEESGQIDPLESRIIRNLLAFGAIKVEDIMTPRSVMLSFEENKTVAELLVDRPKLTFSRLPIYDGDLDNITGFVLKTDMLLAKVNHAVHKPLTQFKREITFVFSKMKLFDLLEFMLKNRIHIAITVGEYGEVKGLVTLEDVFETLLGLEIVDEIDRVEDMQALARQMMDRRVERLGMKLSDDEHHEDNSNDAKL
ncbi:CNNM domain-containing protein [Psychrobacter sp. AOP22-C1-22]|uniref:CNNM domain-containing protein n=1 Tax=unclassified Psychrobacter TaxID=196806 RepID=UPI001787AB8B|nr:MULTISPECIES: hemolysin family protein [unclassified Psychrobacter]MDN5802336.1 hemolysin family protein [Psychrobacter sp.]MBE0407704.1 HlyC/CorC family transporter [Psychrobacter sp. FME6]MBE0445335.1 HlyC/CorC family transporter [Psychrobacter sp. FME5]MDN5890781.1 hemolysin family protein [Psychrobacter sp.]MDN5898308.1 hemolysin family protein [Psychrobacter sp.]